MLRFSWGRRQKPPTNNHFDEHESIFLCQVARIPLGKWVIRHRIHPDQGLDQNDHNPLKYKLVYKAEGCCLEFYQDPSSCLWRIVVNEEQVFYGADDRLAKLWDQAFRFATLSEQEQRYAKAAQAISQSLEQ